MAEPPYRGCVDELSARAAPAVESIGRYAETGVAQRARGSPDPVLRCVLLVLGNWEKEDGRPFSVPNSAPARQTGLKDRAIRYRLQQLDGVWFTRQLKRS